MHCSVKGRGGTQRHSLWVCHLIVLQRVPEARQVLRQLKAAAEAKATSAADTAAVNKGTTAKVLLQYC